MKQRLTTLATIVNFLAHSLSHIVWGGGLGIINTLLFLLVLHPLPTLIEHVALEDVGLIGRTSVNFGVFSLSFLL